MLGLGCRVNAERAKLWSPNAINAIAWFSAYDSTTVVESGGLVSLWYDLSPNGYNLPQSVVASQPQYSSQGIVHTGVTRLQAINNIGINNSFTIVELKQYSDVTEGINTTSTNSGTFIRSAGAGYERNAWAASAQNNTTGTAQINNVKAILTQALENGVGGNFWTNGQKEEAFTDVVNARSVDAPLKTTNSTIVNSYTLHELIIFDRKLTDDELDLVHGFVAWKWNLTSLLPIGHPYKTLPPTV